MSSEFMGKERPILTKAPIAVAILQMKFDMSDIDIAVFDKYDAEISRLFPHKKSTFAADIDFPNTGLKVGPTTLTANSRATGYVYFSSNQKTKLNLSEGTITFTDEAEYKSWDEFKGNAFKCIDIFRDLLERRIITRMSIRFINRFEFMSFDDPSRYFRMLISTAHGTDALSYPVSKFSFKVNFNIDEDSYAIVSHDMTEVGGKSIYFLDIDTLYRCNSIFEPEFISSSYNRLKNIEDDIFFGNITEETLELCR